jgi:hypothetical protein
MRPSILGADFTSENPYVQRGRLGMSEQTQRKLVISCRGTIHALYQGKLTLAELGNALFYLDCTEDRIFVDGGDISEIVERHGNHEGAFALYRMTRQAVKAAAKQGRVIWAQEGDDGWARLNGLLSANLEPAVGPLDCPYSPHKVVLAALNVKLPYYIVWEKLLEKAA